MRTRHIAAASTSLAVLATFGTIACTTAQTPPESDGSSATTGASTARSTATTTTPSSSRLAGSDVSRRLPLRGRVIVIDPGHQLGNSTHPRQINRLVNAGGFKKACNTTGTSTNGGWPEATFNWRVARALRRQLERKGARVYMTRHSNSYDRWGPCIDVRGRLGNKVDADAVVSIHANGASSSNHGFFVIRPGFRKGWTGDILRPSRRLARKVRHGLRVAGAHVNNSYPSIDTRTDLGTLNWSNKPIVMLELGNMRNAREARRMHRRAYQRRVYARGIRIGLTRFLRR